MKEFGYIRTACAVPVIKTGDCVANAQEIIALCEEAYENQSGIVVFPELCVTGYTCGDLFFQQTLKQETAWAVDKIRAWSKEKAMLIVIGAAVPMDGGLYNCAVVISEGSVVGVVPKTYVPNNQEYYEKRWFRSAKDLRSKTTNFFGDPVAVGTGLLFRHRDFSAVAVAVEICEDLWAPIPPSSYAALAGATIIVNPSASNEVIGKSEYRKALIRQQSARLNAGYLYCSSGFGESTTDVVFGGDALIYEKGTLLAKSKRFELESQLVFGDIDVESIVRDREIQTSFGDSTALLEGYESLECGFNACDAKEVRRYVNPHPFVPADEERRKERCEEIFNIQTMALGSRVTHIGSPTMVVGISGGLDSTLALLVCVNVCDRFKLPRESIHAVTMPGFGTTDRTYDNAVSLIRSLGATFHEISIKAATEGHFKDIGHDIRVHDVTYENAQARERTQILMDLANTLGGIVIGTGDLSELALGWATYNGDHMSMYGVNGGIPKTLVRYLVRHVADDSKDAEIRRILYDVLDTPVSPELLPPDEKGAIAQKTEDLVGPYELHDFFIYHVLRNGFGPEKIYFMAKQAFEGVYDEVTLYKWLRNFYWRFFTQQFKRSCIPDGPKVGSVSLSPRGDWRMPSDAKVRIWLDALDRLEG